MADFQNRGLVKQITGLWALKKLDSDFESDTTDNFTAES